MGDWRNRAACREQDPELFFPIGDGSAAHEQILQATAVCARCPVRQQCLDFALTTEQTAGIWGGLTEAERRELHRSRRVAASSEAEERPAAVGLTKGRHR